MNEQEKAAAKVVLERLQKSETTNSETHTLAHAYLALTQGVVNRVNAEKSAP